MKFGIRYVFTDSLSKYENILRGWQRDVLVIINSQKYAVELICIESLLNHYNTGHNILGYYPISPNTIIVKDISKDEINKIIYQLCKTDFFIKLGYENKTQSEYDGIDEFNIGKSEKYLNKISMNDSMINVVVKVGEKRIVLYIMSINQILQEYDFEIKTKGYYLTKPNLVLVDKLDKKVIERTVIELYKIGFFNRIGPLDENSDWGIFEYLHSNKNIK